MNGNSYLPEHHLKINYLVIRSQDGMQLFMAKVLYVRFFGVSNLSKLTNCKYIDRSFINTIIKYIFVKNVLFNTDFAYTI